MNNNRNIMNTHFRAVIAAALIFVTTLMLFSQIALAEAGSMIPIGDPNAEPPELKAKAAALYSLDLDRVVYAKNENKKMSPYSITKILTCYLAIENLWLDEEVTVSADATQAYENGTTIYLKEGEKIRVCDLVYGALLASGNDAAYALGEAVSGSEKDFADLMNKTVSEWGCKDTHFVNANGWKNDEHYTTAHDMSIIAAKCFENVSLLTMSLEKEYTIPETNMTEARQLKNYFLSAVKKVNGITGGKTGSWSEDDCSIALQFEKDGLKAVVILLGDTHKSRAKDVKKLIDFSPVVTPGFLVSDKGDIVTTARVRHGEITKAELSVDGATVAYPASNDTKDIEVVTDIDKLEAPLSKGDKAGTYKVFVDGSLVGEHDLVMAEDVETGWFPSYLYISNRQTMIIAFALLCLLFLIMVINRVKKAGKKPAGKHDKTGK